MLSNKDDIQAKEDISKDPTTDISNTEKMRIVKDIWSVYDRDNSGYLDTLEAEALMKVVFKNCGQSWNEKKFKAVFAKIDKNGDGKLSEKELYESLQILTG